MHKIEAGYCTTKLVYSCFDSLSEISLTMLQYVFPFRGTDEQIHKQLFTLWPWPEVKGYKYSMLDYLSVTAECLLSPWPFTPWGQQNPCGCCHFSARYWRQSRRRRRSSELRQKEGISHLSFTVVSHICVIWCSSKTLYACVGVWTYTQMLI